MTVVDLANYFQYLLQIAFFVFCLVFFIKKIRSSGKVREEFLIKMRPVAYFGEAMICLIVTPILLYMVALAIKGELSLTVLFVSIIVGAGVIVVPILAYRVLYKGVPNP